MKPGISVYQRLWRSSTNRTYFDYLDNNHVSPYHLSYTLRIMQVTSLFPNQVQRLKLRSGGLTNLTYFETFVYNSWELLELPICCFHFLSICPIIFATIQVSPWELLNSAAQIYFITQKIIYYTSAHNFSFYNFKYLPV